MGVFGWSYAVLMPAFARDVLDRGANGYGMLMSASGAGAFIGALVVATYGHLFTPRRLALGGVWLFSIALLAFSLSEIFIVALVFLHRRWIRHAAVFLDIKHGAANDRAG